MRGLISSSFHCCPRSTGCEAAPQKSSGAATPVRVAAATEGPAAPTIRTNGLLVNEDEIRLSFKVGGVIRRSGTEGEHVRKGQQLAEIEQTEIDAQVEQARQAHEKAKRDLERGERLYNDKVISLEQLQDLRTQTAMAGRLQIRGVQLELRRDHRAARRHRAAPARRGARAGHSGPRRSSCSARRTKVSSFAPVWPIARSCRSSSATRAGPARRASRRLIEGRVTEVASAWIPRAACSGSRSRSIRRSAAQERAGRGAHDHAVFRARGRSAFTCRSGRSSKATAAGPHVRARQGARAASRRRGGVHRGRERRAGRRIQRGEQVITDGAQYLEDGERVAIVEPSHCANAAAPWSSHELARISDRRYQFTLVAFAMLVALGVTSFTEHSAAGRSVLPDLGFQIVAGIPAQSRRTSNAWW